MPSFIYLFTIAKLANSANKGSREVEFDLLSRQWRWWSIQGWMFSGDTTFVTHDAFIFVLESLCLLSPTPTFKWHSCDRMYFHRSTVCCWLCWLVRLRLKCFVLFIFQHEVPSKWYFVRHTEAPCPFIACILIVYIHILLRVVCVEPTWEVAVGSENGLRSKE